MSGLKDSIRTPLLLAAQKGHLATVKLLVNFDVDLFYCDAEGYSALQWAQIKGHKELADMLITSLGIHIERNVLNYRKIF